MAKRNPLVNYIVQRVGIQTVLVLGIVVFGFLLVDDLTWRWDLTEDGRFSISDASHRLSAELEDPLTIRAYFSENIPESVRPIQQQVFDILAEYEAHGGGNIKVERYDPLESKAVASEAENYGIRPSELRIYKATEAKAIQVYGSLVMLYRDRASEVIDVAQRYPQGYEGLSVLEYEISSKIWQLSHDKPRLGLLGFLTRPGGRPGLPPQFGGGQARPEYNELRRMLGESFSVETVDLKQSEPDPAKIPLLVVVRPKEFTDVEIFRLDQYLMKGGRVLMFLMQGLIDNQPFPPHTFTYQPFKTGLDAWLEHNGLRVPNEFVLQGLNAKQIQVVRDEDTPLGRMPVGRLVKNWFWPVFFREEGALDKDNPAVQTLREVPMWWPHPVDVLENKIGDKVATVLVRSHEKESWRWKQITRVDRRSLDARADGPNRSDLRSSAVAVAVEGEFDSFFADKPVPPSLTAADEGDDEEDGENGEEKKEDEKEADEKKANTPDIVKRTKTPTQLVVVGNAFFISDALLSQRAESAQIASLLAINLVDWLARSKELIALRAKRYTSRTIVDEDYDDEMKKLEERAEAGDIDREEFLEAYSNAEEEQKSRREADRWKNVLLPCFFILVIGAAVWILREARRRRWDVPGGEAPVSVETGDER